MSLHDELTDVQHCLDDLVRTVARLERSIARLRETDRATDPLARDDVITIAEAPYDSSLWTDADDEGLGVPGRHAP
ncbi:hypothetical protein [Streptomyces sp. NPDC057682]|uniref:hypothetical protein n=1 Tax=Streptomyces sp. NPDC057682 TaxID=3346210 RepID=UPI0036A050B0